MHAGVLEGDSIALVVGKLSAQWGCRRVSLSFTTHHKAIDHNLMTIGQRALLLWAMKLCVLSKRRLVPIPRLTGRS